jgi:hypothetical protein
VLVTELETVISRFLANLDGVVVGHVGLQDMNIGASAQLFRYLFVCRNLVSDEADDRVARILGYLAKELELL